MLQAKGSGVVTRSESIEAGILVAIAAQTSAAHSAQLVWSAALFGVPSHRAHKA
jgi:hypothetical protein